jgi:hypothetical protein
MHTPLCPAHHVCPKHRMVPVAAILMLLLIPLAWFGRRGRPGPTPNPSRLGQTRSSST